MAIIEIFSEDRKQIYRELFASYPEYFPETIDAAAQFLSLAAQAHIKQEATFGEYGLTSGRFTLLMFLRAEESRALSPSELAKRASVSRGTMTQFIDALERDHLVQRVDDLNDRRAMLVKLTVKGEETIKKIVPVFLRYLSVFTQSLNKEERKQLLYLMSKVAEGMSSFQI